MSLQRFSKKKKKFIKQRENFFSSSWLIYAVTKQLNSETHKFPLLGIFNFLCTNQNFQQLHKIQRISVHTNADFFLGGGAFACPVTPSKHDHIKAQTHWCECVLRIRKLGVNSHQCFAGNNFCSRIVFALWRCRVKTHGEQFNFSVHSSFSFFHWIVRNFAGECQDSQHIHFAKTSQEDKMFGRR